MPDVQEIIERLRECARPGREARLEQEVIPLWQAVAAVHAAADARTREIVEWLREIQFYDSAGEVARRFPNGGTPGA